MVTYDIGDKVIFTSVGDKVWGEKYGGEEAVVKDVHYRSELDILFKDGQLLTVHPEEVKRIES